MKTKMFLALLLVVVLCFTLIGCGSSEVDEPSESESTSGWNEVEDGTITQAHLDMFDAIATETVGSSYTPIRLVATQVVSGVNYKFLCEQTIVTQEAQTVEKYVIIYRDLQGNCSLVSVEDVND